MKTLDTLGRLTKSFTLDPFLLRDSGTDDTDEVGRRVDEDNDENTEDAATGAAAAEHCPLDVLKCKIDIRQSSPSSTPKYLLDELIFRMYAAKLHWYKISFI